MISTVEQSILRTCGTRTSASTSASVGSCGHDPQSLPSDLIHTSFPAASSLQILEGISGNVVSSSLVLAHVIDDHRGRVRLEVIVVVAQSAPTARVEAIDAEVDVVAGGGCWRGPGGSMSLARLTLRATENPLNSTQCLRAVPLPTAPGQWAVTVSTRAGGHGAESCSRSCR